MEEMRLRGEEEEVVVEVVVTGVHRRGEVAGVGLGGRTRGIRIGLRLGRAALHREPGAGVVEVAA